MIEKGKKVTFHLESRTSDGTIIQSTKNQEPLVFEYGSENNFRPIIIQSLEGKRTGDTIDITLDPSEAFGEINEELIVELPRSKFPDEIKEDQIIEAHLPATNENQPKTTTVKILKIEDENVTIDGNHVLAGETILMTLNILSVE